MSNLDERIPHWRITYGLIYNSFFVKYSQEISYKINFQVIDLKEHLKESQKRENVLAHDLRSLTELLKDTQHNLRLSNDKVQHLTVIYRF